jgi:hypothetical protein
MMSTLICQLSCVCSVRGVVKSAITSGSEREARRSTHTAPLQKRHVEEHAPQLFSRSRTPTAFAACFSCCICKRLLYSVAMKNEITYAVESTGMYHGRIVTRESSSTDRLWAHNHADALRNKGFVVTIIERCSKCLCETCRCAEWGL